LKYAKIFIVETSVDKNCFCVNFVKVRTAKWGKVYDKFCGAH